MLKIPLQHAHTKLDQSLIEEVDELRTIAFGSTPDSRRSEFGQYPTPTPIAMQMAGMFHARKNTIRLLDPGAGVGSLTAAYISHLCTQKSLPKRLEVTAFEIDRDLVSSLSRTLAKCGQVCSDVDIVFDARVKCGDFISAAVEMIESGLFGKGEKFDCAILNPPYKKISADSPHRRLLRNVGIETGNLYTAFLALVILLLEPGGEMVAITPRSFCNGPYFKPFRRLLLREMSIQRIHVFESRKAIFSEDEVLQENVILHAIKTRKGQAKTIISSSRGFDDGTVFREVSHDELIKRNDPDQFIHIVADDDGTRISDLMGKLTCSLDDIGLNVSTGRVVDFRSRSWLQADPGQNTVPLIYPTHFSDGWVSWPKAGQKKPNAFTSNEQSDKWLIPAAVHVLTKRFSAKEETRRVVAAIFDPTKIPCKRVAFENHVNYFHDKGRGLSLCLAKGLAAFLNSTLVDSYFRQFNGHTQVNASDLRKLRYPTRIELEHLGGIIGDIFPDQDELDRLVENGFLIWQKE